MLKLCDLFNYYHHHHYFTNDDGLLVHEGGGDGVWDGGVWKSGWVIMSWLVLDVGSTFKGPVDVDCHGVIAYSSLVEVI